MAESEEPVRSLIVADRQCENVGCRAAWGLGNQMFLYAASEKTKIEAATGNSNPTVHEAIWDTDMHRPITRKLVNESQSIFLKLQQQTAGNSVQKPQMVQVSREYRSVIQACLMDLRVAIKKCQNDSEHRGLEAQLELFEMIELIWSLAEILFVESSPGGVILNQLLDWLRLHFVRGTHLAQEAMQDEVPDQHPHYWQAVFLLVLQGRVEDVRHMLSVHSDSSKETFRVLDQLLRTMPVFGSLPGQSLSEFDMRWRHWQEDCIQVLEEGTFASDLQLEIICKVLCGEDDVFVELKELLGSWYCMLISKLLYQNPSVKVFDLQYHTQPCVEAYGGDSVMQRWDHILLSALEFDIHQVIKESSTVLGNWWFVSHLTDLLHHCGKLESQSLSFGSNLREFLLLEYASSLLSHHSLWQVGINYLDHCSEYGRYYLELFIEHLPLDTEKKAQKILRICEQRDMQDQIRSICKVMGMKALSNGRLGSALSWALRSKDVAFATVIAEKLLFEYSESGGFSNLDLVDNLGPSMLLSSKLTFLGKYREFHRLYEGGDLKAAAALLLSLLTARVAPKKFWPTLLLDALPLLETENVVFSSQQTYELMHCVEHINLERRLDAKEAKNKKAKAQDVKIKSQPQSGDLVDKEKFDLMKLALARNLARAIVQEGSVLS